MAKPRFVVLTRHSVTVTHRAGGSREGLLSQQLADVINGEIPEVFIDNIIDVINDVISEGGGSDESWGVPLAMGIRVIVDVYW